jgi:hypothetical protein
VKHFANGLGLICTRVAADAAADAAAGHLRRDHQIVNRSAVVVIARHEPKKECILRKRERRKRKKNVLQFASSKRLDTINPPIPSLPACMLQDSHVTPDSLVQYLG